MNKIVKKILTATLAISFLLAATAYAEVVEPFSPQTYTNGADADGWTRPSKPIKQGVKNLSNNQGYFVVGKPNAGKLSTGKIGNKYLEPKTDHTTDPAHQGYAMLTGINANSLSDWWDVDGGEVAIVSPIYPIEQTSSAHLYYFIGFYKGDSGDDNYAYIDYSRDGGKTWNAWVRFDDSAKNPKSTLIKKPEWTATKNVVLKAGDQFRVRAYAGDPTNGLHEDILEMGIDDITISNDLDGDGIADSIDPDIDGDGIPNEIEGMNQEPPRDTDGDGIPDYMSLDSDGDGKSDAEETDNGTNTYKDTDGDGIPDWVDADDNTTPGSGGGDSDGDGVNDATECAARFPHCADSNNDGKPDYMDKNIKNGSNKATGQVGSVDDLSKNQHANSSLVKTGLKGEGSGSAGQWMLLALGMLLSWRRKQ